MPEIRKLLETTIQLPPSIQNQLLWSLAVLVLLTVFRWLAVRIIFRQTEDVRVRYRAGKVASYVSVAVGLLVIGRIWIPALKNIATFLGLVSAGLTIALRDMVASIAGWVYILWQRPFDVGDRIQMGEHAGDVVDQRVSQFTLLEIGNWVGADQSTGRVIHIPNSRVFTHPIANYTKGFRYIWNELSLLVTFESNWEKAAALLQEIADTHASHLTESAMESLRQAARKSMIVYSTFTPKVWTSVADSGVRLTMRYLSDPRQRRGTADSIWKDVLRAFANCDDIDLAYPTIRRYSNVAEGKPATGGPAKGGFRRDPPDPETESEI
ncbi:MAG: mechanosensitive ion channel family protein [Acidobacteriota bacterium]